MNNNIDVVKQLEAKNKEIYYKKLCIDIDSNSEILVITLNNSISVLLNELTSKLLEINLQENNKELIETFQLKLNNSLQELIKKRSSKLKEEAYNKIEIDYKEILQNEKTTIIKNISKVLIDVIHEIKEYGKSLNVFNKTRLEEYLNNIFYNKVIGKIDESITNMDNILYNSYQSNITKYHDLNVKTLNLV